MSGTTEKTYSEPGGTVAANGATRAGLGLALALMVTAQFMVILDFSIVNVALPSIQRALAFSPVGVEGVITAYAAAFGGVLILGGRLADQFGRRRIFITGLLAFAVTSLGCALASTAAILIVARVLQGLSAAILAPAALALVTTTFTEGAERNRALGVFGAATALGFVAGQVLGGVLTDLIGWRSIFIINVPVATVAALLSRNAIAADGPIKTRRVPDLLGAVLITSSMALLVWAPTRGAQRGWASTGFLAATAVALMLLATFVMLEARRRDPLVRLSILRSRWLAGTNAATAITGALNGATVLLCTLFLQQAHGYSPLQAGLAFVPLGLTGLLFGVRCAGPLITRLGVRAVLTGAPLIAALAIAGLSRLPGGGDYLPLAPYLILIGASFTTTAVATTVAVSSGVAPHQQGMAAALRQTAFQLGVALGVAILLSIAASHTSNLLASAHPPGRSDALTAGFRLSLTILSGLSALGAFIAYAALRSRTARP